MDEPNIRSGVISAVEDQVRRADRVSVFIEGTFAFGVDRLVAAEFGLRSGRSLDDDEVRAVLAADEASRALSAAVLLLSHRPRSTAEVEDRLRRRGFSGRAIERATERLRELNYLDDQEFARYWVENRVEHQPRGRRLLRQELRRKGVDPETVDAAIDTADIDEQSAALELARKRAARLRGLERDVQRRRLASYLQRRGYGWDVVRVALDEVLDAEPDE